MKNMLAHGACVGAAAGAGGMRERQRPHPYDMLPERWGFNWKERLNARGNVWTQSFDDPLDMWMPSWSEP